MPLFNLLQQQSRRSILLISGILLALIGGLDYLTGAELSFSIFYLLPIVLGAWFVGRRAGVTLSLLGAGIWMANDITSHSYSSNAILFWNGGVRLGFFLIVTFMLASLHRAKRQQEELREFIVHDLRSPLASVLSAQEYLQEMAANSLSEDERSLVNISISSCKRLMTLINSLLDLARIESGKMQLNLQPVRLETVFDTAQHQVAALALRRNIRLVQQIAPEAARVMADEQVIVRVLVNLLSNALTYSPEDAAVTLAAAPDAEQQIAIRVIDQGRGIPAEWVDKVFDRFSQVEVRKAGVGAGSGLGLAFCRAAVEAQGGKIRLESEVGKGTTVIFTLPRAQV